MLKRDLKRRLEGLLVTALLLAFAGCVSSEVVHLKHSIKGDVVQCGPYTKAGNINAATQAALAELRYCINDFQRQGYERIAPAGLPKTDQSRPIP